MTSIKVKFRPSTVAGHDGTIYYQLIHEKKVRQLISDYKVQPTEWDEGRSMVRITPQSDRRALIASIREKIRHDIERLTRIDRKLDAGGLGYTADDVINEFHRYVQDYSLFNFMGNIIARFRKNGKIRTSETYQSALNSFRNFNQGHDIMIDRMTPEVMEAYEAWLRKRGVVPNTSSFYARILRATYNRAVENDLIKNRHPFRHVYTGVDKTVKRALPLTMIKRIKNLDLSNNHALDYARDMFLLSFYLRGMSFVDMVFLKKTDLRSGYVSYRRRKTGQMLIIKWTDEMQQILTKYPENQSNYLLPIIRNPNAKEQYVYRNVGYNINKKLKIIAKKLGITIPLTLYVARHSWASAAKAKGIPVSVISEGMGHDSESTTQIYLASLNTSVVDKANSIILKSL